MYKHSYDYGDKLARQRAADMSFINGLLVLPVVGLMAYFVVSTTIMLLVANGTRADFAGAGFWLWPWRFILGI